MAKSCLRMLGDDKATVAIEFAFVLVIFLGILFAIIAFGFQFASRIALSYAVAEGGRSAVAGLTTAERESLANDAVSQVLTSYAPLIDIGRATITATSLGATPQGEAIRVRVVYTDDRFNVFPFLPALNASSQVQTIYFVADPSG